MVRSAMCSGCRALAGSSWSYLLTYLCFGAPASAGFSLIT